MKNLLAIVLISIGIFVIMFEPFNLSLFSSGKGGNGEVAVSEKINLINVDIPSANTNIIPEERETVKAVLEGRGNLTLDQDGDTIKVQLKRKWFDWMLFDQSKLTIYIPNDYDENMKIKLGSGNLDFAGQSNKEPFQLKTLALDMSSGNTDFEYLSVKEFKLDGSSGNVNVNSLKTETGTFDISSGNIDVKHYSGKLNAELSSGKMDVQFDQLNDSIDVDISSGKVDLDLPQDSNFTLKGNVSSGNISSEFPLENQKIDDNDIEGKYGTGEHSIDLSVSSGNIKVH